MQSQSTANASPKSQHTSAVPLYLSLIVMEWALLRYVWAGVRSPKGGGLLELVGGRWNSWRDVLRDVAIAAPFWVVWEGAAKLMNFLLGPSHLESVDALLPQSLVEILLWFALSISAGICEEIIFRGYLQRQFGALTGNNAVAVIMQAILFGAAHAYQGWKPVVVITGLGALFGVLAVRCKTLRPGMIAHAWADINSGFLKLF